MTTDDFLALLPAALASELRLAGGGGGLAFVLRVDRGIDAPSLVLELRRLRPLAAMTEAEGLAYALGPWSGLPDPDELLFELACPVAGEDFAVAFAGSLAHSLEVPLSVRKDRGKR